MMIDKERFPFIRAKIKTAFAVADFDDQVAEEIAFHLTDWLQDLAGISILFQNIDEIEEEKIRMNVYQFLAHVPNHLAAAKKLTGLGPIEDIFNVGVLTEDDDSK